VAEGPGDHTFPLLLRIGDLPPDPVPEHVRVRPVRFACGVESDHVEHRAEARGDRDVPRLAGLGLLGPDADDGGEDVAPL
jgi:hypothetical protein